MLIHSFILCAFALSDLFATGLAQYTPVFDDLKTEPSFRSPHINITHRSSDESLFAPGYYFYEPFALDGAQGAPIIFDSHGELIWYGRDVTVHQAKNFRVCDYLGSKATHLCWSEFSFTTLNSERSRNRIFDNTYAPVRRDFGAVGDLDDPNPHEFNMLEGGETFTQAVYQMRRTNLEAFRGPKDGFVIDPCFQEVDVVTGRAVFRWCGLDHLKLWETIMFPHVPGQTNYSEMIGGDATSTSPWDFAHINGIDKITSGPSAGDYLVSARHHDTIYKIAGRSTLSGARPGTILWRLGGEGAIQNSFTMQDNFTFSRQHHISFLGYSASSSSDSKTPKLKISLFNNGWTVRSKAGFENRASSGKVILLDEDAMTAELLHEYAQPNGGLAVAQGGMHVTPSGNAVVGWGTVPEISEFAEDGTLLFHAAFNDGTARNYRAYKFPWVGKPSYAPKLLAYSLHCSSSASSSSLSASENTNTSSTNTTSSGSISVSPPLIAYVSWNGATEVTAWRFHISPLSPRGPWLPAGTIPRSGFETTANLTALMAGTPSGYALELFHKSRGGSVMAGGGGGVGVAGNFAPYVSVEALDARGKVIGSASVQTWVPSPDIRVSANCDEVGCAGATVPQPKPGTKEAAVYKVTGGGEAAVGHGDGDGADDNDDGIKRTAGHFPYPPAQSCAEECIAHAGFSRGAAVVALLVLLVVLECLVLFGTWIVRSCVERRRGRRNVDLRSVDLREQWKDGAYMDEEGAGAGGGQGRKNEVKWERVREQGRDGKDETLRAPKGTRRPSVKRSKSGWEEPGKPVVMLKASGHEA